MRTGKKFEHFTKKRHKQSTNTRKALCNHYNGRVKKTDNVKCWLQNSRSLSSCRMVWTPRASESTGKEQSYCAGGGDWSWLPGGGWSATPRLHPGGKGRKEQRREKKEEREEERKRKEGRRFLRVKCRPKTLEGMMESENQKVPKPVGQSLMRTRISTQAQKECPINHWCLTKGSSHLQTLADTHLRRWLELASPVLGQNKVTAHENNTAICRIPDKKHDLNLNCYETLNKPK